MAELQQLMAQLELVLSRIAGRNDWLQMEQALVPRATVCPSSW
jgi:hypothetical protein